MPHVIDSLCFIYLFLSIAWISLTLLGLLNIEVIPRKCQKIRLRVKRKLSIPCKLVLSVDVMLLNDSKESFNKHLRITELKKDNMNKFIID